MVRDELDDADVLANEGSRTGAMEYKDGSVCDCVLLGCAVLLVWTSVSTKCVMD